MHHLNNNNNVNVDSLFTSLSLRIYFFRWLSSACSEIINQPKPKRAVADLYKNSKREREDVGFICYKILGYFLWFSILYTPGRQHHVNYTTKPKSKRLGQGDAHLKYAKIQNHCHCQMKRLYWMLKNGYNEMMLSMVTNWIGDRSIENTGPPKATPMFRSGDHLLKARVLSASSISAIKNEFWRFSWSGK